MPAGQPAYFESADQLEDEIQKYFEEGVKIKKVVLGPPNKRYTEEIPVPTITGLALYLGFESRQSFYDYEKRPEFSYTIKKARLLIENEYEEMLAIGNVAGAIFALKNMGWADKRETDITTGGEKINFGGIQIVKPDDPDKEVQA